MKKYIYIYIYIYILFFKVVKTKIISFKQNKKRLLLLILENMGDRTFSVHKTKMAIECWFFKDYFNVSCFWLTVKLPHKGLSLHKCKKKFCPQKILPNFQIKFPRHNRWEAETMIMQNLPNFLLDIP